MHWDDKASAAVWVLRLSDFLHECKTKGQSSGQMKSDKFVSVYSDTTQERRRPRLIILLSTRGIKMLVTIQSFILIAAWRSFD